jgi:hypothetical protein
VDEVAKVDTPVAAQVLAKRAVFDLSPGVRKEAVEKLRARKPETYRTMLLAALRYPWAPAADHAAQALTALKDRTAIPDLAALLDKPDPHLPVYDTRLKTGVVQELVRVNHMRNCFLCHAVSSNPGDLVRGAVPRPGKPLPQLYYNTAQADFVQADVTYLRQDFSVAQPVENASPWPTLQRYDYVVRRRKATDAEMAQLRDSPSGSYPQRDAVLTALRGVSGRDLGTSTEAWQTYAAGLAPADKSQPPKESAAPEKKTGPAGITATSPDGTRVARAKGSQVRVTDAADKEVFATISAGADVLAVAFAPDGKVVYFSGQDRELTAWSLATKERLYHVSLGAVAGSVTVSDDGKVVTCKGIGFVVKVEAAGGKRLSSSGLLDP